MGGRSQEPGSGSRWYLSWSAQVSAAITRLLLVALTSGDLKNLNCRTSQGLVKTVWLTLNLTEEKMGSTLEHIGTGDHFLNTTPAAQILRETINKLDLLKLKSFYKALKAIKQRTWSTRQNDSLQNWKRSSLTPHQTEV